MARSNVVADWRGEQDEPGSWETRYALGRTFSNLFELRFDDAGRCAAFVEWYVEHPRSND